MGEEELHASMQFFFNATLFTARSENVLCVRWVSMHSGFFQIYNTCTPIIPGQHMELLQFLLDRSFENILSLKAFTAGLWQSFVCNFHVSPLQDLIKA